MKIKIENIKIGTRYRKELGDIEVLAKSLDEIGLLHPIVIDAANYLVAGQRRLMAANRLGWTSIECHVVNIDAIVLGEFAENEIREGFRLSERVAISERIEAREKDLAKGRQREHGGTSPGIKKTLSKNFTKCLDDPNKRKAKSRTAKAVGVSAPTLDKAKAVVEAAQKEPEKYKHLVDKMDNTGKVSAPYRELKETQMKENVIEQSPPEGKYKTIVVDPPWPQQKILRDVRPNQDAFDYPTMTLDEIKALPVSEVAMDDCHLFLWTTEKQLPFAFDLIKQWGFRYIFTIVWHKSGGFQPVGLAQYNCEFVLYARIGSPKFIDTKNFFCCFDGERRGHSRKPIEFYNTIKRVTESPRLDYFSRELIDGFDQYGNETGKFQTG